jgi:hypothetical protein
MACLIAQGRADKSPSPRVPGASCGCASQSEALACAPPAAHCRRSRRSRSLAGLHEGSLDARRCGVAACTARRKLRSARVCAARMRQVRGRTARAYAQGCAGGPERWLVMSDTELHRLSSSVAGPRSARRPRRARAGADQRIFSPGMRGCRRRWRSCAAGSEHAAPCTRQRWPQQLRMKLKVCGPSCGACVSRQAVQGAAAHPCTMRQGAESGVCSSTPLRLLRRTVLPAPSVLCCDCWLAPLRLHYRARQRAQWRTGAIRPPAGPHASACTAAKRPACARCAGQQPSKRPSYRGSRCGSGRSTPRSRCPRSMVAHSVTAPPLAATLPTVSPSRCATRAG